MNKRPTHKETKSQSKHGSVMGHGATSLLRANMLAMLVAVGVLALSGFIAYLQYLSLINTSQDTKYKEQATTLAAHLAGRLHALGDMVTTFAVADKALVTAIQTRNYPALRSREAEILRNFPDANRVRFILPGDDQLDNTITPPLSYACLELARLAEQGENTPPFEVHLFGGEIEHLDMLRPVMYEGKLIASLIVTQDVDMLKSWIDDLQPEGGYVELQQGVDGEVISLFGRGDKSLKIDKQPYVVTVENSYWLLDYWPPSTIGATEARHMGFIATFVIAAGILAVFFLTFGTFISSMLKADLRRMVNFIIDFSLGKRIHSYPVRLAEVKKVLQEKENDLSVMSDFSETREAIHEKAEHYVPDISFGETGISVEEVDSSKKDSNQQ